MSESGKAKPAKTLTYEGGARELKAKPNRQKRNAGFMKENIGFMGLGIMGHAMAANIARAGYPVVVFNRTPRDLGRTSWAHSSGRSRCPHLPGDTPG